MVFQTEIRKKCPDCYECQMCSKDRCRLCRRGAHKGDVSELKTGFTYGEYLEWKRKKTQTDKVSSVPVIDMSECSECESCLVLCPSVFIRNDDTGHIEVAEFSEYPAEDIQEAMNCCPKDCIAWEEPGI